MPSVKERSAAFTCGVILLLIVCVPISSSSQPVTSAGESSEFERTPTDSIRDSVQVLVLQSKRLKDTRGGPGKLDSAITLLESARRLAENNLGSQDTTLAWVLIELADRVYYKSDWSRVDSLVSQAIAIWESIDPRHPEIARCLFTRAAVYHRVQGRPTEAEALYLQMIDLLADAPVEYRHMYANAYNNLAMVRRATGRPEGLDTLYLRAIELWRTSLREQDKVTAALIGLGAVYMYDQGNPEEAESLYLEALAIQEQVLGPDHFRLHFTYKFLSDLYQRREMFDSALVCIRRAARIVENSRGTEDLHLSWVMREYGDVELALGRNAEAIDRYRQALEIMISNLSPSHIEIAETHRVLAMAQWASGQLADALHSYEKSLAVRQQSAEVVFPYASEQEKLRFLQKYRLVDPSLLTGAVKTDSKAALKLALEMLVRGKARVLDAVAAERAAALCSDDAALIRQVEDHALICGEIADLSLGTSHDLDAELLRDSLRGLYDYKDRLERSISGDCEDFRLDLAAGRFSVDDVAPTLPHGSALWELIRYLPCNFDRLSTNGQWSSPRYMAFALDGSGSIGAVDLGDAGHIDSLVMAYREAMNVALSRLLIPGSNEAALEMQLARITGQLYELLASPVEAIHGSAEQILVSPDGTLCLLPFELLQSPDGEYLIEKYQISYISSGRDLVRFGEGLADRGHQAVVMSDPDYMSEPRAAPQPQPVMLADVSSDPVYRGPGDRSQCLNTLFGALPSTRVEGERLADLLGEEDVSRIERYFGSSASEATLKSMQTPPRILHLATHGYYCEGARFADVGGLQENPLLYSGLALAGANRLIMGTTATDSAADDGILTSLEASALDLVGTELVVLSACQTGVGDVVSGEGVYGLRRAFQLAGAHTVVMSMFAVPDQSTVTLMERFYENWLSGQPKAAALRSTQLSMIRERREAHGAAHPLFWGGFILVGDPN